VGCIGLVENIIAREEKERGSREDISGEGPFGLNL